SIGEARPYGRSHQVPQRKCPGSTHQSRRRLFPGSESCWSISLRPTLTLPSSADLAVIFNGYDRLTLVADILVQASPENIRKLLASLSGWGEGWARELTPADFTPQEGSIRVMEDFDLDIFYPNARLLARLLPPPSAGAEHWFNTS